MICFLSRERFTAHRQVHGRERSGQASLGAAHPALLQHALDLVRARWREMKLSRQTSRDNGKGGGRSGGETPVGLLVGWTDVNACVH